LKNKISLWVLFMLITAMFFSTSVVAIIIQKQNRRTSYDIVRKTFHIMMKDIEEKQKELLSSSRQMAVSDDMGSNVRYVAESKLQVDFSIMKVAYENISESIYHIAQNANVWKVAAYDADGDLIAFYLSENQKIFLGYVHRIPSVKYEII